MAALQHYMSTHQNIYTGLCIYIPTFLQILQ